MYLCVCLYEHLCVCVHLCVGLCVYTPMCVLSVSQRPLHPEFLAQVGGAHGAWRPLAALGGDTCIPTSLKASAQPSRTEGPVHSRLPVSGRSLGYEPWEPHCPKELEWLGLPESLRNYFRLYQWFVTPGKLICVLSFLNMKKNYKHEQKTSSQWT